MVNDQRVIILFVKYPEKGRVKTRLARSLGDDAAVKIYCQLVSRLVRMLREVSVEEVRVCYDPSEKRQQIEAWLRPIWLDAGEVLASEEVSNKEPALVFRPQCEGDLGARLQLAFSQVFEENESSGVPESQVLTIGSDCIEIDGQTFQEAWKSLEEKDVVFGPTFDGGYYMVGMNSSYPDIFENIPWSSETTMEVSLQRALESGLDVALLDEKHDIDTEEDWRRAELKFSLSDWGDQGDASV